MADAAYFLSPNDRAPRRQTRQGITAQMSIQSPEFNFVRVDDACPEFRDRRDDFAQVSFQKVFDQRSLVAIINIGEESADGLRSQVHIPF
jgi:hypothetical protein